MKAFFVLSRWFGSNQAPTIHRPKSVVVWRWLSIVLGVCTGLSAFAQAPSLSWTNNVNGRLFAVDTADNTYAVTTNGAVVTINNAGTSVQTNELTRLPGLAQRDSVGNFYLCGSFDGTNDFGGTKLVGGWIDSINYYPPRWRAGYPTVYLAKYNSTGTLQWATNFGINHSINTVGDLVVNPDGTATLSYNTSSGKTYVAGYNAAGQIVWLDNLTITDSDLQDGTLRLTPSSSTNGVFLNFDNLTHSILLGTYDSYGDVNLISGSTAFFSAGKAYAKPVLSTNGAGFVAGLAATNSLAPSILDIWQSSTLIASNSVSGSEPWTLAGDSSGGVYVSGLSGNFAKFDGGANLLWSTNYGSPVDVMLTGSSGSQFVSLDNGSVAKLNAGSTAPSRIPPVIAWAAGVNGRLFALDAVDNSYAFTTNGAVVELNSSGSMVQSNMLTHLPGIGQRDVAGNIYVTGSFDGTNDFGGTTLVGGWFDSYDFPKPTYQRGYPTVYVAKYSGSGSLLWVTNIGVNAVHNTANDLALNPDGSITVAYNTGAYGTLVGFSSSGSIVWQGNPAGNYTYPTMVRIANISSTNGAYFVYHYDTFGTTLSGLYSYSAGSPQFVTVGPFPGVWYNNLALNAKPIPGASNDVYLAGLTLPNPDKIPILTLSQSSGVESTNLLGSIEQYDLAGDASGNIYLGGVDGSLNKYNSSVALQWSTNYGSPVDVLLFDSTGNAFLGLDNGSVVRLGSPSIPLSIPLALKATGSALVFTWPATATNVVLQVSTSLNGNWTNVSMPTNIVGGQCVVSNTMTAPAAFYRLK